MRKILSARTTFLTIIFKKKKTSWQGEDDGTDSSAIDGEISSGLSENYNNYDAGEFGDLIDTSVAAVPSTSDIIFSLRGNGCWSCHASSFEGNFCSIFSALFRIFFLKHLNFKF